jgi:hypothetical protein
MKPILISHCIGVLTVIFLHLSIALPAEAQGCVAIRQMAGCGTSLFTNGNIFEPGWQFTAAYRYFQSDRHFRGTHEEPDRQTSNTEVINDSHSLDLNFGYSINKRWLLNMSLPLVYNERSSLYEHGRTERHSSRSNGLGDLRISALHWLWHPDSSAFGNLGIGFGVKLPTGNFQAMDYFYNVGPEGQAEYRPVDQSIQPADGGLGLTLELQGFGRLARNLYFYGSAFYLINPMEVNGARTYRETLSPMLANEAIMSIPDQYSVRAGLGLSDILRHGLSLTIGGRFEGVPVQDLIGGSTGFRRPGYVLSLEPGIDIMHGRHNFSLTLPVALVRNRLQSVTDLETEMATGIPRQGDAAFADWVLNISYTLAFGRRNPVLQGL